MIIRIMKSLDMMHIKITKTQKYSQTNVERGPYLYCHIFSLANNNPEKKRINKGRSDNYRV